MVFAVCTEISIYNYYVSDYFVGTIFIDVERLKYDTFKNI